MTSNMDQKVTKAVRELYKRSAYAKRLFDLFAERERDAAATSIDRLVALLGVSHEEARSLADRLQEAGCGKLMLGRRGHKTRFVWTYSCISLSKAAAGQTVALDEPENPVPEVEEEAEASSATAPAQLTIADAKRALSLSLGVPESSIEISVRY